LISRLVPFGYSIKFSETFSLFYIFDCVENCVLSNGLYCISLQNNVTYSLIHVHTCCYLFFNTHTYLYNKKNTIRHTWRKPWRSTKIGGGGPR
jgi:hypothetical protein